MKERPALSDNPTITTPFYENAGMSLNRLCCTNIEIEFFTFSHATTKVAVLMLDKIISHVLALRHLLVNMLFISFLCGKQKKNAIKHASKGIMNCYR